MVVLGKKKGGGTQAIQSENQEKKKEALILSPAKNKVETAKANPEGLAFNRQPPYGVSLISLDLIYL
jgi:hypothetical protein